MKTFSKNLLKEPLLEFLKKTYLGEGEIIYEALMKTSFLSEIQQGEYSEAFIIWKQSLKVESNLSSLGSKINRFYREEV